MKLGARRFLKLSIAFGVVVAGVLFFLALVATERAIGTTCPFPLDRFDSFPESIRVVARDGTELRISAENGERRIAMPLDAFSPNLVKALLAGEDGRFAEHSGVDFFAIGRAAFDNLRARRVVSGASTLTSQLVRIVEPRPRTWMAKVIEAFRARQLERALTKDQILEHYLNLAPLGSGIRGFEAAARFWYGKHASELAIDEAATLVALLPAPSKRAPPRANPSSSTGSEGGGLGALRIARDRVLDRMCERGDLAPADRAALVAKPVTAMHHDWPFLATHFCDGALRHGLSTKNKGGELRTTLDAEMQERVEAIVRADTTPVDGAAVVVLDRRDGAPRVVVGGRDWNYSRVDVSLQRRDVGSTLKPFLYGAAIANGIAGPDSLVMDRAKAFGDYEPWNFDGSFQGSLPLKEALVQSRNLPAVEMLSRLGLPRFRSMLRSLGLPVRQSKLTLDAALGSSAFSPRELAEAWRRFSDPGFAVAEADATSRAKILSILATGHPLPGAPSDYAIVGEGRVSWKTGTSSGRRDAWCVGVTPRFAIAVWLGNLDGRAARHGVELVGVKVAAPLFARIVATLDPSDY